MIYHKLLKLSRKFKSRFFLFEELSRLDSKAKIDSKLFSALYWKAFRSPSVAEDWIPLHRFIGHLGPLILVDIGANIGDFAVEYHANFPVNHVYCFEPVPATYAKLQQRLANSPFGSTAFNMAVSEHVGKVSFNIYDSSTLNSMHQYVKELTAGEQERPIPVDVLSVQAGPSQCWLEATPAPQIRPDHLPLGWPGLFPGQFFLMGGWRDDGVGFAFFLLKAGYFTQIACRLLELEKQQGYLPHAA